MVVKKKRPRKRHDITFASKVTTTARLSRAQLIENYLSNLNPAMHWASRSVVVPCRPPIRHPFHTPVNGYRGYILRLEIKSAIVSPLNELSHAYAYSRSSSTGSGVRVLGLFVARCTPVSRTYNIHTHIYMYMYVHLYTHIYIYVCTWCT